MGDADEAEVETRRGERRFWSRATGSLSHPLLLLLIGAAFSSYLIPSLTRGWQNHQKEVELKAGLASDLTEKTTAFIMAVQSVELATRDTHSGPRTPKEIATHQAQIDELNNRYQQWEVNSAVIGSRLRTYFPDHSLVADWRSLSDAITGFYAIEGTLDLASRNTQVIRLLGQVETLPLGRLSRDLKREQARLQSVLPDEYELRWANLRAELIARRDALIQRVLEADSSAF